MRAVNVMDLVGLELDPWSPRLTLKFAPIALPPLDERVADAYDVDRTVAGRVFQALRGVDDMLAHQRAGYRHRLVARCPVCTSLDGRLTDADDVSDIPCKLVVESNDNPRARGVSVRCLGGCLPERIAPALERVVAEHEASLVQDRANEEADRRAAMSQATSILALRGLASTSWLVEGLIPDESLTLLMGAAGARKTFVAMHAGIAVADGLSWFGRATRRGPVLLVLLEGAPKDHGRRLDALARGLGTTLEALGGHLDLFPHPLRLDEPESTARLAEYIREFRYGLIVIDNLSEIRGDGSENDSAVMSDALRPLAQLAHGGGLGGVILPPVAVVVLHHANAQGGVRGSTAICQHADHILKIEAASDRNDAAITLTRGKARTGGGIESLRFRFVDRADGAIVPEEVVRRDEHGERDAQERGDDPRRRAILSSLPATAEQIYRALKGTAGRKAVQSLRDALVAEGTIALRDGGVYHVVEPAAE